MPTDSNFGSVSNFRTFANVVKSYIGVGLLALPYAFKLGGALVGVVGYFVVGAMALHCMHLLLRCKRHLAQQDRVERRLRDYNNNKREEEGEERQEQATKLKQKQEKKNVGEKAFKYEKLEWKEAKEQGGEEEGNEKVGRKEKEREEDEEEYEAREEEDEANGGLCEEGGLCPLEELNDDDDLLLEQGPTSVETFTDVGRKAFGRIGALSVDISLLSSHIGFCCIYIIFLGDNLHSLAPFLPSSVWAMLTIVPLVLLCWLRSFKLLAPFSLIAVLFCLFGFAVILFYGIFLRDEEEGGREFPNDSVKAYFDSWKDFPIFLSLTIYAFEGIGLVIPMESAAKDKKNFPRLYTAGLSFVMTLYLTFGLLGYLSFGEGTKTMAILNLPNSAPLVTILKLGFIVTALVSYPLYMFPVVERLECLLFGSSLNRSNADNTNHNHTNVLIINPLPSHVPFSPSSSNKSDEDIELNNVSPSTISFSPLHEQQTVEGTTKSSNEEEIITVQMNCFQRFKLETACYAFRVVMVLSTVGIAIAVPEFDLVTSLIGSVCSTTMAFVIPALFHYRLFPHNSRWVQAKDLTLVVWGIAASLLCTSLTLVSLYERLFGSSA
ncbi:hypothetical protein QOT17_000949 [Balamuthia mandrillaris]